MKKALGQIPLDMMKANFGTIDGLLAEKREAERNMLNGRSFRLDAWHLTAISVICILSLAGAAWAFETGNNNWTPLSSTAAAITGPVTLTADKLQMASKSFMLSSGKDVDAGHLGDAAKIADMADKPSSAKLFKTRIPRATKLLQSNTICGGEKDATWLLAVFADEGLALAFFSGAGEPQMNYAVTSNGHNLCGTFTYVPSGGK